MDLAARGARPGNSVAAQRAIVHRQCRHTERSHVSDTAAVRGCVHVNERIGHRHGSARTINPAAAEAAVVAERALIDGQR